MYLLPDLSAARQRDIERDMHRDRLARMAACHYSCSHPNVAERLARALGFVATCDACIGGDR